MLNRSSSLVIKWLSKSGCRRRPISGKLLISGQPASILYCQPCMEVLRPQVERWRRWVRSIGQAASKGPRES